MLVEASVPRLELSHVHRPRRASGPGPHAAADPGPPGRPADGAERKKGWQLAEVNGDADPYGIHYLLNRARWSVAEARTAYILAEAGVGYHMVPLGEGPP